MNEDIFEWLLLPAVIIVGLGLGAAMVFAMSMAGTGAMSAGG
jgi:hypothetical protein